VKGTNFTGPHYVITSWNINRHTN